MPSSNSTLIHKLQQAINIKYGYKLLYNKQQWYSDDRDKPITLYVLKRAIWDENKQKNTSVEIFSSYSQIQIVLFLRDLWYKLNEWELPTDNDEWNSIREKINMDGGNIL